jgi:hypothetical protein
MNRFVTAGVSIWMDIGDVCPVLNVTFDFPGGSRACQGFKAFFACPADRTFPLIMQIFKTGALGDLSFFVALVRIVDIAAVYGLALPHVFGIRHGFFSLSVRLFGWITFPLPDISHIFNEYFFSTGFISPNLHSGMPTI